MLLFWRIRYLDSRDRIFKDRDLWLETNALDPVARAAVEYCEELKGAARERGILWYRHLFSEKELSDDAMKELRNRLGRVSSFALTDYFEDEHGEPLTSKRMAEILTGEPEAIMFPPGARQHDIDYALADKRPIQIDQITLSADDLRILAYFSRDLREMLSLAFSREGPGTLNSIGNADPEVETAVTDEELRSFIMVFRRLYMEGEPAGFLKAVKVFARVAGESPLGDWIAGEGVEHEQELQQTPHVIPYVGTGKFPFTRKRLIDVLLYTRYAHQPDDKRERQYQKCLAAVAGRRGLLTWLSLSAMWECALHMRNAGRIIADFFERYCKVHGEVCDVIQSVAQDHPGIGKLEKKDDRERRLFDEGVARLSEQMWEQHGRPLGGPQQFAKEAYVRLAAELGRAAE